MTLTLAARKGSDFSVLSRQIRDAKLLDRRRISYTFRIGFTLLAFVGGWVAFALVGNSWYQTIVAATLGLLFTQVAFLGHDGGHQQIWRSKRANDWLGIIAGDLMTGLSYGWWVDKHNRHHAKPNFEGHDPDIGEGVLAFTTEQAANRRGPVSRFITRNQALLFFPLLTLEGLNLHVASIQSLRDGRTHKRRGVEIALFTVHVLAYLGAVLLVLDPVKALVFVTIHQAVFGVYMGCSFAPNHKGMPTIPPGVQIDFLRRQVLTSRNVRGGWFTDFLLGGLNYQVEHHLFPNMPRPSLRRAQALVRAFCAEHEIRYTETTLFGSYAAALRHLHDLGAPLRAQAAQIGASRA
ncbi:MAG TPA: acyl-CoA desaturase [Jatrophihabitans sp.]|jgi:fatty acid desaturase|uniref:fatty acid desaturase family protein n=1 Tax=Jatrophihabitans sp. TaxID=1932789 RepID=UPI002E0B9A81|nr:acyl-CoA desaturase [Jatrophihabitans sp.]